MFYTTIYEGLFLPEESSGEVFEASLHATSSTQVENDWRVDDVRVVQLQHQTHIIVLLHE